MACVSMVRVKGNKMAAAEVEVLSLRATQETMSRFTYPYVADGVSIPVLCGNFASSALSIEDPGRADVAPASCRANQAFVFHRTGVCRFPPSRLAPRRKR